MPAIPDISGRDIAHAHDLPHEKRLTLAADAHDEVLPGRAPLVYTAGPISKDTLEGIRSGVEVGVTIRNLGAIPFTPQLSCLSHLISPQTYTWYMALDYELIRDHVDAIIRLPGESAGADAEVDYAETLGLPVFWWVDGADRGQFARWVANYRSENPERGL